MDWYLESLNANVLKSLREDVSRQAREVIGILKPRMFKSASSDEVNVYVDPALAGKYKINLHLMKKNDEERAEDIEASSSEQPTVKTASEPSPDFREATVSFVSKKTSDPNYLCTIVLQKPEDKVWCISAYLMETYLGRYAYRANFYFRKESSKAAHRCYERVSRSVRELRQDVIDDEMIQNTIPRMMQKRLSSIEGEIEPRINKTATYLDPANVAPSNPEKSVASYIPTKRSVTDDLIMPEE